MELKIYLFSQTQQLHNFETFLQLFALSESEQLLCLTQTPNYVLLHNSNTEITIDYTCNCVDSCMLHIDFGILKLSFDFWHIGYRRVFLL